jgi:hypothetical protein
MGIPFRSSASFGRRIEYWIIGRMLKDGLDVYTPTVDDHAVDAVVVRKDGSIAKVQVKARSRDVVFTNAALFAAITHPDPIQDFWFVFYSERMDTTWLMTSEEFIREAVQNKTGKNAGKRTIWLNGSRRNKATGQMEEYTKPQFEKYVVNDFSRIREKKDGEHS